jgi:hypothetical protein
MASAILTTLMSGGYAAGKYPIITGKNGTVGTSYETLQEGDTDISQHSIFGAGATIDITSSAVADDSGSTGAITIRIFGANAAYQPISETVTLDGRTAVATTQTFTRVFGVEVLTAGTGLINAGDIYGVVTGSSAGWTNGVPDTLTSLAFKMLASMGLCMNGQWTIPPGQRYRLKKVTWDTRAQAGELAIFTRFLGGAAGTKILTRELEFESFTAGHNVIELPTYPPITGPCDVIMKALAAGASGIVSGAMYFERMNPY